MNINSFTSSSMREYEMAVKGLWGVVKHWCSKYNERNLERSTESEAPRPQGGASGKCRYDYRVGFPPRPCYGQEGGASSRLARDSSEGG